MCKRHWWKEKLSPEISCLPKCYILDLSVNKKNDLFFLVYEHLVKLTISRLAVDLGALFWTYGQKSCWNRLRKGSASDGHHFSTSFVTYVQKRSPKTTASLRALTASARKEIESRQSSVVTSVLQLLSNSGITILLGKQQSKQPAWLALNYWKTAFSSVVGVSLATLVKERSGWLRKLGDGSINLRSLDPH